jgi:protein-disulfide isomerase
MPQPQEAMLRNELGRKLRRSRTLSIILAVVAAAAVLFGVLQATSGAGSPAGSGETKNQSDSELAPNKADDDPAASSGIERRIDGDPMAIGDLDAPVVMSEWIDFRCPYCAVYSRETFEQVVKEFVDSGEVRIEIHDVAFFGEESVRAAVAARAAGEQGRYFEFVTAVYAAAPESGHPDLPPDELIAFAKQVGVPDIAKFTEDLEREDLREAVQQSTALAQQVGVNSVPMFAANGKAIAGAQPIDVFRTFLKQALAD